jgi:hypothetical protein
MHGDEEPGEKKRRTKVCVRYPSLRRSIVCVGGGLEFYLPDGGGG